MSRRLEQAAALLRLTVEPGVEATVMTGSPYLNGRFRLVLKADGSLRTCRHARTTPGALWYVLWGPSEAVCTRCCTALSRAVHGTAEDHRCDVCGVISPTGLFKFAIDGPKCIVLGGACESCRSIVSPDWTGDAAVTR